MVCQTYSVSAQNTITCIGGDQNNIPGGFVGKISNVYSAPISSSGVGTWYPDYGGYYAYGYYTIDSLSHQCVVSKGYIYCVNGENPVAYPPQSDLSADANTLTANWYSGYAIPGASEYGKACAVLNSNGYPTGYMYCVGGLYLDDLGNIDFYAAGQSQSSYYSPLPLVSGSWQSTAAYPYDWYKAPVVAGGGNAPSLDNSSKVYGLNCVIANVAGGNYIYCAGGAVLTYNVTSATLNYPYNYPSTGWRLAGHSYFAPVSSSGIGQWSPTTGLIGVFPDCVTNNGYDYCIETGGTAYYAKLTTTGISWESTTALPGSITPDQCEIWDNDIYCVETLTSTYNFITGYTYGSPTYYAPISSTGIGTWQETTSYPKIT